MKIVGVKNFAIVVIDDIKLLNFIVISPFDTLD